MTNLAWWALAGLGGVLLVLQLLLLLRRGDAGVAQALAQAQDRQAREMERLERGLTQQLALVQQALIAQGGESARLQNEQIDAFRLQLQALADGNERRLAELRDAVERRLSALQAGNEARLEQMRATVDEKLHATLEQRLGESFRQVAERLEQDRKSTRLNSSHSQQSRMPSSA